MQDNIITEEDEAILIASGESSTYRTSADLIEKPDETSTSGSNRASSAAPSRGPESRPRLRDSDDTFWQACRTSRLSSERCEVKPATIMPRKFKSKMKRPMNRKANEEEGTDRLQGQLPH